MVFDPQILSSQSSREKKNRQTSLASLTSSMFESIKGLKNRLKCSDVIQRQQFYFIKDQRLENHRDIYFYFVTLPDFRVQPREKRNLLFLQQPVFKNGSYDKMIELAIVTVNPPICRVRSVSCCSVRKNLLTLSRSK